MEGVLAGPDGRCGLNSRSGTVCPSGSGIFSRAAAPRLEPRGREEEVLLHDGMALAADGGGEDVMVDVGVWTMGASKPSVKLEVLLTYGCCTRSSDDAEPSES